MIVTGVFFFRISCPGSEVGEHICHRGEGGRGAGERVRLTDGLTRTRLSPNHYTKLVLFPSFCGCLTQVELGMDMHTFITTEFAASHALAASPKP